MGDGRLTLSLLLRIRFPHGRPHLRQPRKRIGNKKTGPWRVRFQFVGTGADYHLPEGNS